MRFMGSLTVVIALGAVAGAAGCATPTPDGSPSARASPSVVPSYQSPRTARDLWAEIVSLSDRLKAATARGNGSPGPATTPICAELRALSDDLFQRTREFRALQMTDRAQLAMDGAAGICPTQPGSAQGLLEGALMDLPFPVGTRSPFR